MVVEKRYKQTEVGEIPEVWEVKKLGEITTLLTNGFVGSAKIHYSENNDDILYIQGYNVLENGFNFHGIKYVTRDFHSKHQKSSLLENDLLTVQTGDVGLTTIVPKELVGSNCHALIITRYRKKEAFAKFICYYLNSKSGRSRLKLIETGTTMKHLNCGDMIEFLVPLPPLPEQTAIANALSDMDALIAQTEKIIEKKKAIKQGVMQELLRPKEGWVTKQLGEVCDLRNGYAFKSGNYNQNGEYLIVTISNVQDGYLDTTEFSKINTLPSDIQDFQLLNLGDLILSLTGNVGRLCRVTLNNCLLNQRVGKLIPVNINSDYLFFYLLNSCFKKTMIQNAVGGAQGNIGKGTVLDYKISFPENPDDQYSIAEISKYIQFEIEILEKKLQKLRLQKQGMMQALLTGKIRLV